MALAGVRIFIQIVDAVSTESEAPLDVMYLAAQFQRTFRKIWPILSGDASDNRFFHSFSIATF